MAGGSRRGSSDSKGGSRPGKAGSAGPPSPIPDGEPAEGTGQRHTLDLIVEGLLNADDPLDYFEDMKIIGHGGTAEVLKATRKSDGSTVALKKFRADTPLVDIANELRTLRLCAHKHINGYLEGYIWENRVYLVLAYCVGSLTDILHIFKEPLQEREIAAVARHCLEALHYMHTRCNTVHRDIKANNILLAADGKALLGDFGIAKVLSGELKTNTFIGSPYWMAPEVILAMETGTYSFAVDVWSLGITLIELAETKPPLFDLHAMSACYHIANNQPPSLTDPSRWSPAFADFVSRCLVASPEDRATTKQLLEHDFVRRTGSTAESMEVLKDLIRRSRLKRAEVHGVDITELARTGLVNNLSPPRDKALTKVSEASEPRSEAGSEHSSDGGDDAAAPAADADVDADANGNDDGTAAAASATPGTPPSARAATPKRGSSPSPKVARAIAAAQESLRSSLEPGGRGAAGGAAADGAGAGAAASQQQQKQRSHRRSDSAASAQRPDDTIKLPNQLAKEEADAKSRATMNLKSQMKEISKLRNKHTDELRKMQEKNDAEVQALAKVQDQAAAALKRSHETALKEHARETAFELGKLHKANAAATKRAEDELKKAWATARKEFKTTVKHELKQQKKQHGKELSKAALNDMRDAYKARQMSEFDAAEKRCFTLELRALNCQHEMAEAELKIQRVRSEFELRERQLQEAAAQLSEHRTGPVCDLQRKHIKEIQAKRWEHQRERHETIEKQMAGQHSSGVEALQKRQRTMSKKVASSLKKLTPMDEEVLRKFAEQQKEAKQAPVKNVGGASPGVAPASPLAEVNLDELLNPGKTRHSSKKLSSLSKEARKALKAAREQHIKEQTEKLEDDQARALEEKMRAQAEHLQDLRAQHAVEAKLLKKTLAKEMEDFESRMQKIRTSTEQYNKMERNNLAASKKDGMKKPFKKAAESIDVQRNLLSSTLDDLRDLYASMRGRAKSRPAVLAELSVPL